MKIKNRATGILAYLVFGKALQGGEHRDDYDDRVHVSGDIGATKATIDWAKKHRKWERNYAHFTLSFSPKEAAVMEDMSEADKAQMMEEMVRMTVAHYAPHRSPDELVHYAELHYPIKKIDPKTGKTRKPHIHLVLPLVDPVTNDQLTIIPDDKIWESAIQSEICSKFDALDDPAWIAKTKNNTPKSKNGKAAVKLAHYLYQKQPKSGKELYEALSTYEDLDTDAKNNIALSTRTVQETGLVAKLKVVTKLKYNGEPVGRINLQGDRFKFLDPLINQYLSTCDDPETHQALRDKFKAEFWEDTRKPKSLFHLKKTQKHQAEIEKKYNESKIDRKTLAGDRTARKKLIESRYKNWLKHGKVNKSLSAKSLAHKQQRDEEYNDVLEQDIDTFTRGQRSFYVMFNKNVQHRFTGEGVYYRDRKNHNKITFSDKVNRFRLVDHGEKITALTQRDTDLRKVARLMIEQGLAKGWVMGSIHFWGSDEWVKIANEELELRKRTDVPAPIPNFDNTVQLKYANQRVFPSQRTAHNLKNNANKKAKNICDTINNRVTVESMLAAAERLDMPLSSEAIEFVTDNGKRKFIHKESGKILSPIDFFTKGLKMQIADVIPALHESVVEIEFGGKLPAKKPTGAVTGAALEAQQEAEADLSYINKSQEELNPDDYSPQGKPKPSDDLSEDDDNDGGTSNDGISYPPRL